MKKQKNRCGKLPYVIFVISALFSASLIFNNNIWFDEAYTLSLIRHDYPEIIEILKSDMHPPLYFISLKSFCEIFGYSVLSTKIFSVIGYTATLSIGLITVRKHFDAQRAAVYMLTVGAIPMSLYFSVQQRSYQWCIFFVTLCFVEILLFLEKRKAYHCAIAAGAALFAAYNHIYALLAVGIIFCFANIYVLAKSRKQLKAIIISDAVMIAGYLPWVLPLLSQAEDAYGDFWLSGVEPLSLIVFASGIVISALILLKKENRKMPIIFAMICILGIQATGLIVTVFIRPFYIARYSVVILGIFALLIAFGTNSLKTSLKKALYSLLCVMNIACVVFTGIFEYDPGMKEFFSRFDKISSKSDTFIYCDTSFGIISYYYPENKHICTYNESWFAAFGNVECVENSDLVNKLSFENNVWFVKNRSRKTPRYISDNYKLKLIDSFKCDFNDFELYSVQE